MRGWSAPRCSGPGRGADGHPPYVRRGDELVHVASVNGRATPLVVVAGDSSADLASQRLPHRVLLSAVGPIFTLIVEPQSGKPRSWPHRAAAYASAGASQRRRAGGFSHRGGPWPRSAGRFLSAAGPQRSTRLVPAYERLFAGLRRLAREDGTRRSRRGVRRSDRDGSPSERRSVLISVGRGRE
jgi:hypothetical protein